MNGWTEALSDGKKFLATVRKAALSKKFSSPIRYNLAAMALEQYVMAICMLHSTLPQNHTLTDLMDAISLHVAVDVNLQKMILKYEDAQRLCSLDDYERRDLEPLELEEFTGAVVAFCTVLEAHAAGHGAAQPC